MIYLFNGISNFMGYLMPKQSLQKNISDTIQLIAERIRSSFPAKEY